MFITEAELRELWRNGRGALPAFPPGTRFSPSALDFLKAHGLSVQFAAPLTPAPLTPSPLPPRPEALPAALLLAGAHARRFRLPELAGQLAALADYSRALAEAERHSQPTPAWPPAGLDTALIGGAASLPAPDPGPEDHEMLLWLNYVRALARAAGDEPHLRTAAALGALMAQFRAGRLAWRPPGV